MTISATAPIYTSRGDSTRASTCYSSKTASMRSSRATTRSGRIRGLVDCTRARCTRLQRVNIRSQSHRCNRFTNAWCASLNVDASA